MKIILYFTVCLFTICAIAMAENAFAENSGDKFISDLSRCTKDSDCVSATVAWPACNHTCGKYKHEKCDKTERICPAMNLTTPILADCAANVPCIEPKRIWCENGRCKSE